MKPDYLRELSIALCEGAYNLRSGKYQVDREAFEALKRLVDRDPDVVPVDIETMALRALARAVCAHWSCESTTGPIMVHGKALEALRTALGCDETPAPNAAYNAGQIARLAQLFGELDDGLRGRPFTWSGGVRRMWMSLLRRAGVELVTQTQAAKRGHIIKQGAKPVGSVYFNAPISAYADVWVLTLQTKPKPKGSRRAKGGA